MELSGGRGVYGFVSSLGGAFSLFFKVGLKGLMAVLLVSGLIFLY